ncbi:hypothetical protein BT63DRAFT_436600 [Microthyrium microscopicum]|uniref:Uncharacterized protein n=1 Tax=Microthyrium microscopicum TaxID=703497 RepID=A0A6A6UNS3_9PEZI|nr:hypothetical protein BT63DRAFT_436600 [Microthyrium microscopicum]
MARCQTEGCRKSTEEGELCCEDHYCRSTARSHCAGFQEDGRTEYCCFHRCEFLYPEHAVSPNAGEQCGSKKIDHRYHISREARCDLHLNNPCRRCYDKDRVDGFELCEECLEVVECESWEVDSESSYDTGYVGTDAENNEGYLETSFHECSHDDEGDDDEDQYMYIESREDD